jgi:hypothetical protein
MLDQNISFRPNERRSIETQNIRFRYDGLFIETKPGFPNLVGKYIDALQFNPAHTPQHVSSSVAVSASLEKPMAERIVHAGKDAIEVAGKGGLLITGMNAVTTSQLSGLLQHYQLVQEQNASLAISQNILSYVQSKGGNSIVIGSTAGLITFVVIDNLKPSWDMNYKISIAVIVAMLVSAFIYFYPTKDAPPNPSSVGSTQR